MENMKNLSESVSAYLKDIGAFPGDVVKVTVEREFVYVTLYARNASDQRIVDDEFGDYLTYVRKYPMETPWWN